MLSLLPLVLLGIGGCTGSNVKVVEKYVGLSNSTPPIPLTPEKDTLAVGDQFGHAVSIWDDVCIVSATKRVLQEGYVNSEGVVYIFQRGENRDWKDTGVQLASLIPQDGFGESLSLVDSTAAVGAPRDSQLKSSGGRVYIYYSSSAAHLTLSDEIYPSNPSDNDFFGYSVAIVSDSSLYSKKAVIVGAYGHSHDPHMASSGSVFVFTSAGGTWYQAAYLEPTEVREYGQFGWSVSGFRNTLVVGAPGQESVFLFYLESIERECPHDGPPENMPSGCEYRRALKGGVEVEKGEQRRTQARPHTYTAWEYVEVLHVQNDLEHYSGDKFGSSVSVINDTTLTVVAGAPYDSDLGYSTGSAVVLSLLPKSDVYYSWSPNYPDGHEDRPDDHPDDHPNGGVALEGVSDEYVRTKSRINPIQLDSSVGSGSFVTRTERRSLQGGPEDHGHNVWQLRTNKYAIDKDGNFWALGAKTYGSTGGEMYGCRTAVSESYILVGICASNNVRGRAELLSFNTTSNADVYPVYKGPLFMHEWVKSSDLYDSYGGAGDMFGSSVSIYGSTALVGGFLTGFKSYQSIGTGAAYIYDAIQLLIIRKSESVSTMETFHITASELSYGEIASFCLLAVMLLTVAWRVYTHVKSSRHVLNADRSCDLDQSVGSVDTVDVNSSHPLQGWHNNDDNVREYVESSQSDCHDYSSEYYNAESSPDIEEQLGCDQHPEEYQAQFPAEYELGAVNPKRGRRMPKTFKYLQNKDTHREIYAGNRSKMKGSGKYSK